MQRWPLVLVTFICLSSLEACGQSRFYYYCHVADEIDATTRSAVAFELPDERFGRIFTCALVALNTVGGSALAVFASFVIQVEVRPR
jgi:hypothetical protein